MADHFLETAENIQNGPKQYFQYRLLFMPPWENTKHFAFEFFFNFTYLPTAPKWLKKVSMNKELKNHGLTVSLTNMLKT